MFTTEKRTMRGNTGENMRRSTIGTACCGGVWTSDRVFMLRLSPPDKIGEFFGLYGLAGKFSAVTGPILYGTIVSVLLNAGWGKGAYQVGILSFLILMVIGILFLRGVPDRRTEAPDEADIGPPPDHLLPAFDTPSSDRP